MISINKVCKMGGSDCSNNDNRYTNIALDEAHKSCVTFRHGCVAVASGKVVARGYNNYRTYSKDGLIGSSCSCHAEIDVLRKCLKKNIRKKITIYIVRISTNGKEIMSSMPCIECANKMKLFNIRSIIYSSDNGTMIKTTLSTYNATHYSSGYKAIHSKRVQML